jgi:8-oxo-dGTP pyrophosphatase MutT (NUDIX family)
MKEIRMSLKEVHVVTSFIMHNGRVLILKRSAKVRTMKHKWAGVSGYIEQSEDILERAYKEIEEETGIARRDLILASICPSVRVIDEENSTIWIVHPFLFLLSKNAINNIDIRLDWEHDEYRWIEPKDLLLYDTVPMLKEALESCLGRSLTNL